MEQSNKNKEQLILEAAEYEFFTKGYNGARTISIAERAGVTHAMLHYYFRTKEQLFEKIMDKNMKQIATIMLSIMTKTDLPFVERLKKSIEDHFDFVANNPLLPQFIFHEIISRPERYEMMKDKLFITVNSMFLNLMYDEYCKSKAHEPLFGVLNTTVPAPFIGSNVITFVAETPWIIGRDNSLS
jgi:AcrR family transcriptional regulator